MLKDVLKQARIKKSMKQEDVADLLNITKQTYLKWENGTTEPKASQIAALSKVLGITPNEICYGHLYERYSLEKFITELHKSGVRGEMEVLKTWQYIQNHQGYFDDLNCLNDDDFGGEAYAHDLMEEIATQDPRDL